MKPLSLIFLIIILFPAFGAMPFTRLLPPESSISKVKYIPAFEGLADLQAPFNMIAASPKIEFVDASGKLIDRCSGSAVSDGGVMLTAGHCVEACLAGAQALTKIDGISAVDRTKLAQTRCLVRIDGVISQAEILATNDCRGEDRYKNGTANVDCNGVDYAILKVAGKSAMSRPCFQISSDLPGTGTLVAAIGYPGATVRDIVKKDARDSTGDGPFLTPGETIPFQNHCYRDADPPAPGKRGLKPGRQDFNDGWREEVLKRQVDAGHLLQTTTDVLPGVSGAGLADVKTYSLVGVARSTINNTANIECVGSGFYTSTASIMKALKKDYPQLNLKETLRCENNAFAPRNETESKAPLQRDVVIPAQPTSTR